MEEEQKGGNGGRGGYQDYNYYQQEFGLYDEDPQIETFSSQTFWDMFRSDEVWIVNFYSPGCSHCHDLAPTWRDFGASPPAPHLRSDSRHSTPPLVQRAAGSMERATCSLSIHRAHCICSLECPGQVIGQKTAPMPIHFLNWLHPWRVARVRNPGSATFSHKRTQQKELSSFRGLSFNADARG
jgi:hypothetical protein